MKEDTDRQEELLDDDRQAAGDGSVGIDSEVEGEGPSDRADVAAEVGELREEIGRLNDRHLRLAAEFDNYRKRTERDRQAMASRLQSDLVASLLDVIDDLERVVESGGGGSAESVIEGVRLVEKKFRSILGGAGLEEVMAEGEPFDPSVMEAVATVATADRSMDHHVADVFQRGYRFGEVLVRPARVRVYAWESGTEDA
jgi:molecular chaperone GrpE